MNPELIAQRRILVYSKLEEGRTRVVERFAWLPTKCVGNYHRDHWTEYMVWLEHYKELQKADGKEWHHISNNSLSVSKNT